MSLPYINRMVRLCNNSNLSIADIVKDSGPTLLTESFDLMLRDATIKHFQYIQDITGDIARNYIEDTEKTALDLIYLHENSSSDEKQRILSCLVSSFMIWRKVFCERKHILKSGLEADGNGKYKAIDSITRYYLEKSLATEKKALDMLYSHFYTPYRKSHILFGAPSGTSPLWTQGVYFGHYFDLSKLTPGNLRAWLKSEPNILKDKENLRYNLIHNVDCHSHFNKAQEPTGHTHYVVAKEPNNRPPFSEKYCYDFLFVIFGGFFAFVVSLMLGRLGFSTLGILTPFVVFFMCFLFIKRYESSKKSDIAAVFFRDSTLSVSVFPYNPLNRGDNVVLSDFFPSLYSQPCTVNSRRKYGLCVEYKDKRAVVGVPKVLYLGGNCRGEPSEYEHDACRMWEYFQQFTDPFRPLPDVPELEPFRQYDEATACWDMYLDRPPKLFEEMTDGVFEQYREALQPYAESYDWRISRDENIKNGWQPPPDAWWTLVQTQ